MAPEGPSEPEGSVTAVQTRGAAPNTSTTSSSRRPSLLRSLLDRLRRRRSVEPASPSPAPAPVPPDPDDDAPAIDEAELDALRRDLAAELDRARDRQPARGPAGAATAEKPVLETHGAGAAATTSGHTDESGEPGSQAPVIEPAVSSPSGSLGAEEPPSVVPGELLDPAGSGAPPNEPDEPTAPPRRSWAPDLPPTHPIAARRGG